LKWDKDSADRLPPANRNASPNPSKSDRKNSGANRVTKNSWTGPSLRQLKFRAVSLRIRFGGLEGVQRLYDVDVIAVVSYDQVTNRDDRPLALGYLTIVGAYILPGTSHETATLVDLAVVDPETRSLVLRAGGADTRAGRATLVNVNREARQEGAAGFVEAGDMMIEQFDAALTTFESDVRAGRANVRIVAGNTAGGGGAFGIPEVLILLTVAACRAFRRGPAGPFSRKTTLPS
jgi:rhombotail lipoprotein